MNCLLFSSLTALTLTVGLTAQDPLPPEVDPAIELVQTYVEAFNERDVDLLLALAHDRIQWLSAEGEQVRVETEGHDALAKSLRAYFAGCSSCRSELLWIQRAGSRIVAHELASWESGGKRRSQASLVVYELEGESIRRVTYYPAEAERPNRAGH